MSITSPNDAIKYFCNKKREKENEESKDEAGMKM